ncbi:MAG: serine/threonine protein kinase [Deltaproteobacteria bacterium]|nr:serine/threonine protein kinase [Deltaproteobacteria bacterium]
MNEDNAKAIRALLNERWADIEDATRTLQVGEDETIRPQTLGMTGSRRDRVLSALLDGGRISTPTRRLEVGDVLGMGGMGVVHRGTQASLDREVAIKAVRPDKRSDDTTVKLLQEAWIAGTLQHPNIVPIYDIAVGGEGEPLIVQQRIEGTAWSELLDDDDLVRSTFVVSDPFEWHLRVLAQVCNAVAYAHARGIVHLDIKPSNVMVGSFGEVFLLDWGLAMALTDDGSGRLPLAAANEDVIGTPAFMAPEMLTQGDEPLTERTDVYLLGATLYRLCAGRPPHRGGNPIATMFAAATKEPPPLEGVSEELAAICARCMSTAPGDRIQTAESLRQALQAFLEHRGAIRLAEEATDKLEALEALWGDDPDAPDAPERDDAVRVFFSEARFGLEQAIAVWADEPLAREGLRRLRLGMARWELRRNRPHAAQTLLATLPDPPGDLTAEVRQRIEELGRLGARVEELQALADQQDLTVGMRTRVFITGVLGLCFTALPILRVLRPPPDELNWSLTVASPLAFLTIFTLLVVWARDSMMRSAINRRTVGTVYVLLGCQALLTLAAQAVGLSPAQVLPLLMVLWASVAGLYAVHVESRLVVTAVGYVAAMAAALAWPSAQWWFAAAANFVFTVNALVIWWPTPVWKPRGLADTAESAPEDEPSPP